MTIKFRWKEFGKDLRMSREAYEKGLRELALELHIDKATFSRAENGRPIEAPTLVYLCGWMGVPPYKYIVRKAEAPR